MTKGYRQERKNALGQVTRLKASAKTAMSTGDRDQATCHLEELVALLDVYRHAHVKVTASGRRTTPRKTSDMQTTRMPCLIGFLDRLKSWLGKGQIRVEHYPTKEEAVRQTSAWVQRSARSSTSSKMSISSQMAREKAELAALLVERSKSRELMELSRQQRQLDDRQQMLQLEMRIGAAQAR
ncbi:hypothetical protein CAPTEDRAFT_199716 [Capitella teleta]|uniref:Uncharacterized protein n=1 Tax=Capitella teleta TaxID=283909 RepID=R7V2A3_CAPTE|nr:hypothetical protein CAPTEDRAFT_199716 [Capitella teleta]|eukprot:ELU12983.1 hypothetical protein CAPTEDRAFT_199716 [Capitella teleta]